MGSTIVTWRGARFDPRTRDMLEELARQVSGYVQPSQGSYSTSDPDSGGTHAGGGAVDIRCSILTDDEEAEIVLWGRRIGFAMWLRQESKSWPRHIHGIAIGCPDLSDEARGQVVDYRNGRNGLLGNGPDDGPDVPFTTWEQYSRDLEELSMADVTTLSRKLDDILDATQKQANAIVRQDAASDARLQDSLEYVADLVVRMTRRTQEGIVAVVGQIPGVDPAELAAQLAEDLPSADDIADELARRLSAGKG